MINYIMSLKNIIIGIAIIILTISVVVYGVNTFYNRPEYSNFCEASHTGEVINTQIRCDKVGGKWSSYDYPVSEREEIIKSTGSCDRDFICRESYDKAREKYSRNVFFVTIPLGILIIVLGAVVFGLEAVGAGLMGGGVGTMLFGIGGYWQYTQDWLKFILTLISLIVLIWFAYWFNKKYEKKK